jgi:hypothetical protein
MQHLARWLPMLLTGSVIHGTSGSLAADVAGWLSHPWNIGLTNYQCLI